MLDKKKVQDLLSRYGKSTNIPEDVLKQHNLEIVINGGRTTLQPSGQPKPDQPSNSLTFEDLARYTITHDNDEKVMRLYLFGEDINATYIENKCKPNALRYPVYKVINGDKLNEEKIESILAHGTDVNNYFDHKWGLTRRDAEEVYGFSFNNHSDYMRGTHCMEVLDELLYEHTRPAVLIYDGMQLSQPTMGPEGRESLFIFDLPENKNWALSKLVIINN